MIGHLRWFGLLLCLACAGVSAAAAEGPVPAVDQDYNNGLSLGGRMLPLPAGQWRVLTYFRQQSPATGAVGYNVALVQTGPDHRFRALLMLELIDLGGMRQSDAGLLPVCNGGRAYLSYRDIVNQQTDYMCWKLTRRDLNAAPHGPMFDAVGARARALGMDFPITVSIDAQIRTGSQLLIANLEINPTALVPDASGQNRIAPAELTASGTAAHMGSVIAVEEMLREWTIPWADTLREAVIRPNPTKMPRSAALPFFDAPPGDAPMPPDIGLKLGQKFRNSIPLGAFRIPLPAGEWTVVVHNPKTWPSGAIGIDQVTLAHVLNKRLDGMIAIERRLAQKPTSSQRPCNGPYLILHEAHADDFCATVSSIQFNESKDAIWGVGQLLRSQGIETPSVLAGGYYGFSNLDEEIRVYVYFSSTHIGLPDINVDFPMKTSWAPFVPKWKQWVIRWGQAVRAGFAAALPPGPLPEKWALLDLRSELGLPRTQPAVGDTFVGSFLLDGHAWPLPEGRWTVVSFVPQTGELAKIADDVVLARIAHHRVTGVVQLTTTLPDSLVKNVDHPLATCQGPTSLLNHKLHDERGVLQDCWQVRLYPWSAAENKWPGMPAADGQLRQSGATLPSLMVFANFGITDWSRTVFAEYGFPLDAICPSCRWQRDTMADWTAPKVAHNPTRLGLIYAMVKWTDAWHAVLAHAFYGAGSGTAPARPAEPVLIGSEHALFMRPFNDVDPAFHLGAAQH